MQVLKNDESVVSLALKHNVKIGAHPSYPDKENFGRKTVVMDPDKLKKSILLQINSLHKIIKEQNGTLHHIKAHGALYNDIASDNELAIHFLDGISEFKNDVKLFVPYNSAIERNALKKGFSIIYEAFADRNYDDNLKLVSRDEKDAVISSPELVINHVSEMFLQHKVTTISGNKLPMKVSTFCVHSDTKNAIKIVEVLHKMKF